MSDFDSNPFADPDLNNPFKGVQAEGLMLKVIVQVTATFLGSRIYTIYTLIAEVIETYRKKS